jgi:3-methylfumaryl-CoA hydratase
MSTPAQELEHLKDWIGKTEEVDDVVTIFQIQGLRALFDDPTVPKDGDPCGPMDHWCFFNPRVPASEIGADGHPKRGGFMPPVPLPRRMFGGCRATHHQPFRVGERVHRKSTIQDVVIKPGRTGTLVICTVKVEMSGQNGLAIEEEQDIIYRDNPPADSAGGNVGKTPAAPSDHDWIRTIEPNPVMLFRYSAVTFNGHRIHYDRKYVTEAEGYPGLIVHGPLTASHMLYLSMDKNPGKTVKSFDFQARAPLFDIAPFQVAGKVNPDGSNSLWSITPEGTTGTLATVTYS